MLAHIGYPRMEMVMILCLTVHNLILVPKKGHHKHRLNTSEQILSIKTAANAMFE